MRVVFDTNVLISALLISNSKPALALKKAENYGTVLYSFAMLKEIEDVLSRPKFLPYIDADEITGFIDRIIQSWEKIEIVQKVMICRDKKDNKFLEIVLNGNADILVTGDKDLLILDPFQGMNIVKPSTFLLM